MNTRFRPENVKVVDDPDGTFRVLDYNGLPIGSFFRVRSNAVKAAVQRRAIIQKLIDMSDAPLDSHSRNELPSRAYLKETK